MELKIKITSEIAECIGLWLAEGDNKTTREITFTNNCSALVEFFAKSIQHVFKNYQFSPHVYIYSQKKEKYLLLLKNDRKTTGEIAKEIDVCWKAAYRRLTELQKLNLVDKDTRDIWMGVIPKKEVIVL